MTVQDSIRERIRDPLKIGRFHDQVMSPFEGMGLRRGCGKSPSSLESVKKTDQVARGQGGLVDRPQS